MTNTILITGATDGIGFALARQYAAMGSRLVLVGRRPLASLTDPLFQPHNYCQTDLSQPGWVAQLLSFLDLNDIQQLDVVINNAGVGYVGSIIEQPLQSLSAIMQVNVLAPIALTYALANGYLAPKAKVVFISSIVVSWPARNYAVYAASKAALDGFVRSLQIEWQKHPYIVQLIHPGATRTGMHAKSGLDKAAVDWERFPPAEEVANKIRQRIEAGRRQASVGLVNGLIYHSGRWLQPVVDMLPGKVAKPIGGAGRCLITGAGAGIGRELALRYGEAGYEVVGVDRDQQAVMAVGSEIERRGGRCQMVVVDLSEHAGWQELLGQLENHEPVNIQIHNAGISAFGQFEKIAWVDQERVWALNLLAPIWLTVAMLQRGVWEPAGSLVYLSSLSHYVGYPGASVYAATKDGLTSLARSLRATGLRTTVIFPGPTRTAHARRYSPDNSREERRMPPEAVAEAIFRAEQRGTKRLIPGAGNKLLAMAGRLLPRLMESAMRRTLYEKIDV